MNISGPKFGYFPKPSKTILIVKDPSHLPFAEETFADTGVKITVDGERHLGAVIGSDQFRENFVQQKISNWIDDVKHLSEIGKDEPQLALSAFNKALCMRWGFMQRTIEGIAEKFEPLENIIREMVRRHAQAFV